MALVEGVTSRRVGITHLYNLIVAYCQKNGQNKNSDTEYVPCFIPSAKYYSVESGNIRMYFGVRKMRFQFTGR
jgi:hypothetical protein